MRDDAHMQHQAEVIGIAHLAWAEEPAAADDEIGSATLNGTLSSTSALAAALERTTHQSGLLEKGVAAADVAAELRAAEAEVACLRKLQHDMRQNVAAIICKDIRQAEKNGGTAAGAEACEWAQVVLTALASEDFAKATIKELQKSAPSQRYTI